MTAPAAAQYAASAATNGTIATAPKYQIHEQSDRVVDDAGDERVAGRRLAGRGRATRRTAGRARRTRAARGRTAAGSTASSSAGRRPRRRGARPSPARSSHAQSRQIMRFSSASWWRGSTRKQLLHRNSFSRRGTILVPASPRLVGFVVVFLFVFEAGRDGALAQHDVERFLDVVGVQLLVEVDDVVFFLVGGAPASAASTTATGRPSATTSSSSTSSIVVVEVVVEQVVVEVVVVDRPLRARPRRGLLRRARARPRTRRHSSCSGAFVRGRECGSGVSTAGAGEMLPVEAFRDRSPLGGAEYNAARQSASGRHSAPECARRRRRPRAGMPAKRGRTERGPGDRWGRWVARPARGRRVIAAFSTRTPGQPPNPLVRPAPSRLPAKPRPCGRRLVPGASSSRPQNGVRCQAEARTR